MSDKEMVDFLKGQQDWLLEANGALIRELNSLAASHARLLAALKGVIAVSDRRTVEYDEAHAAIAAVEGGAK